LELIQVIKQGKIQRRLDGAGNLKAGENRCRKIVKLGWLFGAGPIPGTKANISPGGDIRCREKPPVWARKPNGPSVKNLKNSPR